MNGAPGMWWFGDEWATRRLGSSWVEELFLQTALCCIASLYGLHGDHHD